MRHTQRVQVKSRIALISSQTQSRNNLLQSSLSNTRIR